MKKRKKFNKNQAVRSRMIGSKLTFNGDEGADQKACYGTGKIMDYKGLVDMTQLKWRWRIEMTVKSNRAGQERCTPVELQIDQALQLNELTETVKGLVSETVEEWPQVWQSGKITNEWKATIIG